MLRSCADVIEANYHYVLRVKVSKIGLSLNSLFIFMLLKDEGCNTLGLAHVACKDVRPIPLAGVLKVACRPTQMYKQKLTHKVSSPENTLEKV